jgi:hypothetical protein
LALTLPLSALGFPETARHGYVSCSTCHFSPSGRGLLTPYGKTIAKELYSSLRNLADSQETEAPNSPWHVGGQFRLLQWFSQTPSIEKARFFPMQSELEGAYDQNTWALIASVGAWRPMDSTQKAYRAYSRNHFLLLRPSEELILRFGHFRVNHGLGLPDHTILTTESLGWTHSHETYNSEFTYLLDDLVFQATLLSPSKLLVNDESFEGLSLAFTKAFNSKHKLGLNLSQFNREGIAENQFNLHGIATLSESSFFQAEAAYRHFRDKTKSEQAALFSRLSYELRQRLRPFVQLEAAAVEPNKNNITHRGSIGFEWFPINYFDLFFSAGKQSSPNADDSTIITAIGHFYF